jgi:hypothetical protein
MSTNSRGGQLIVRINPDGRMTLSVQGSLTYAEWCYVAETMIARITKEAAASSDLDEAIRKMPGFTPRKVP